MGDRMAGMQKEADKKKLRETLTLSESFFMWLMPVSQIVAWVSTLAAAAGQLSLGQVMLAICGFYSLWAIKNRIFTFKQEKGYYAFSFMGAGECRIQI